MAVFNGDVISDIRIINNTSLFDDPVNRGEYDGVTSAIISSVSVDTAVIKEQLTKKGIKVLELHQNTPLPYINKYSTPNSLGKDRIAIAAAAVLLHPGKDVLIIDAGTCITYDFVNKRNEYIGGSISPGLSMRLKSLNTFTSRLPLLNMPDVGKDIALIGDSTENSMLSGVFHSAFLEVEAVINQYKRLYSSLITVISGGDYKYFEKLVKSNIFATPNVVVLGLKKILDFNEDW